MPKLSGFFETSQDTFGFEPAMAQVVSLLLMWSKQEAVEWRTRCFRAAVTETFTPTLSVFKCCILSLKDIDDGGDDDEPFDAT